MGGAAGAGVGEGGAGLDKTAPAGGPERDEKTIIGGKVHVVCVVGLDGSQRKERRQTCREGPARLLCAHVDVVITHVDGIVDSLVNIWWGRLAGWRDL